MKFTAIVICLVISAFFLVSCNQDNSESASEETASQPAHSHEEISGGLELNDGKKWQVDDHTRNTFSRMIESFANPDPFSLDNEGRKQAGADLLNLIEELIQGCTLQGPAHDQLHEFLTAYVPTVEGLKKSGSVEGAKAIKTHLETYVQYFE